MPKIRHYNSAVTIEASDWLSLEADPGTYSLGAIGKFATTLQNRNAMPGTFPISKPKKSYLDAVEEHLERLSSIQAGRDLMAALIASGHVVTIKPPGRTLMVMSRNAGASISQTHANFDDAFVLLVRYLRQGNVAAAQAELVGAINAAGQMGYHEAELAAVVQQRVQSYNGQHCLNGVAGAPVGIAQRVANLTALEITNLYNGTTAVADGQPLRYLALALERFLSPGIGTSVAIVFDPWAYGMGYLARPPYISVGHELLHALDAMRGTRIFDNEPEEECIYIPCGSFGQIACGGGNRTFTENAFRVGLSQTARALI